MKIQKPSKKKKINIVVHLHIVRVIPIHHLFIQVDFEFPN